MKRDKPWRPVDHPAPLLHLVEPEQAEESLHDPDITDEQAEKIDYVLLIAFIAAMAVLTIIGVVLFVKGTVGR